MCSRWLWACYISGLTKPWWQAVLKRDAEYILACIHFVHLRLLGLMAPMFHVFAGLDSWVPPWFCGVKWKVRQWGLFRMSGFLVLLEISWDLLMPSTNECFLVPCCGTWVYLALELRLVLAQREFANGHVIRHCGQTPTSMHIFM